LTGEMVSPPEAVRVPAGVYGWRGTGNAWLAYPDRLPDGVRQPGAATLPSARSLMVLGLAQLQAGRVLPPEAALPVYVRDRVVQSR
jgi:tRNA threonylcarbamoyladenosine biosynthesis protein TsaB